MSRPPNREHLYARTRPSLFWGVLVTNSIIGSLVALFVVFRFGKESWLSPILGTFSITLAIVVLAGIILAVSGYIWIRVSQHRTVVALERLEVAQAEFMRTMTESLSTANKASKLNSSAVLDLISPQHPTDSAYVRVVPDLSPTKITVIGSDHTAVRLTQWLTEMTSTRVIWLGGQESQSWRQVAEILLQGGSFTRPTVSLRTESFEETADSEVVIIADVPANSKVSTTAVSSVDYQGLSELVKSAVHHSPNAVLIVASRPVDLSTSLALIASQLPREKVIGTAGITETAVLRRQLEVTLAISGSELEAYVLGNPAGVSFPWAMVKNIRNPTAPQSTILASDTLQGILMRHTNPDSANERSAFSNLSQADAPAAAVLTIVNAIITDSHQILPCFVRMDGEYGIHDHCAGVPVRLGHHGVEEILEVPLSPTQLDALLLSMTDPANLTPKQDP